MAEWKDPDDKRKLNMVRVVHFYEDDTVLIIHNKKFLRIPLSELEFNRWSD